MSMAHEDLLRAILRIRPSAEWSLDGDTYDGLNWLDASPKPTLAELEAAHTQVAQLAETESVNRERDRRIAAGFEFQGHQFQADDFARSNMAGAALNATLAISAGAQAGDLRWHGGDADFAWISADNTLVVMDAPTVIALGQKAAAHVEAKIRAARALKNRILSGEVITDIADDTHWNAS